MLGVVVTVVGTGCGRIAFEPVADGAGDVSRPVVPSGALFVFPFDEASGTNTSSEVGSLTGSLVSDVTWVPGIRGSSVRFGGISYIDFPQRSELLIPGALTISAWYRLDRMPLTDECLPLLIHGSQSFTSADNVLYGLNVVSPAFVLFSERLTQEINATSVIAPSNALETGAWRHVVVVRNAVGDVAFYFDGGEAIAAPSVQSVDGGTNGRLRIGADHDLASGCSTFPGALDEIYIYARALDGTEARLLFDAR